MFRYSCATISAHAPDANRGSLFIKLFCKFGCRSKRFFACIELLSFSKWELFPDCVDTICIRPIFGLRNSLRPFYYVAKFHHIPSSRAVDFLLLPLPTMTIVFVAWNCQTGRRIVWADRVAITARALAKLLCRRQEALSFRYCDVQSLDFCCHNFLLIPVNSKVSNSF
jgi:hypothetical protein